MAKKKTSNRNRRPRPPLAAVVAGVTGVAATLGAPAAAITATVGGIVERIVEKNSNRRSPHNNGKRARDAAEKHKALRAAEKQSGEPRANTPGQLIQDAATTTDLIDARAARAHKISSPAVRMQLVEAGRAAASPLVQAALANLDQIDTEPEYEAGDAPSVPGPMAELRDYVESELGEVQEGLEGVSGVVESLKLEIARMTAEVTARLNSNEALDAAQAEGLRELADGLAQLNAFVVANSSTVAAFYGEVRNTGGIPSGNWKADLENGVLFFGDGDSRLRIDVVVILVLLSVALGSTIVVTDADYTPTVSLSLDLVRIPGRRVLFTGGHVVRVGGTGLSDTDSKILGGAAATPVKIHKDLVIQSAGYGIAGGVATLDGKWWPGATDGVGLFLVADADGYYSVTNGAFLIGRKVQMFTSLDMGRIAKLIALVIELKTVGVMWTSVLTMVNPLIERYFTGGPAALFSSMQTAAEQTSAMAPIEKATAGSTYKA